MRTELKLAVESSILLIVSFYAVSLALASYTKLCVLPVDFPVISSQPAPSPLVMAGSDSRYCHTQVICVMRDFETNRLQYRDVSEKEVTLLKILGGRVSRKEFDNLVTMSFHLDEPAFLDMLSRRLEESKQVASNRKPST